MDMEKLTKAQIILLTLLVSFVTSIATGIVTVTLMDQAPPSVSQTINRVVEKTIEVVNPKDQTAIVNREVVIVKEQNVVADVVEKNSEATIKIYQKEDFFGMGVFVDSSGIIATVAQNILKDGTYSIIIGDKQIGLEVLKIDANKQVAYLKTVDSKDGIFKQIFKVAVIANTDSLKLGQSVVVLNKKDSPEVLTGIISSFVKSLTSVDRKEEEQPIEIKIGVKTDIFSDTLAIGAPIFSLDGKLVGLNTGSSESGFVFVNFSKDEVQPIQTTSNAKDSKSEKKAN